MPHFTIEYSANLDSQLDMTAFCDQIRRAALGTGVFETGAVRVRALRCEHYSIADNNPEDAFIDVSLRMGAGRGHVAKKETGDAIFAAMTQHLAALFPSQHFALSFEIREIDAELSYKRNTIHERFRN